MSDGHRTSAIARPRPAARSNITTVTPSAATRRAQASQARPTGDPTGDGTRFGDLTRPISKERQLVKGPGKRVLIAATASVLVAALLAAFFVLPVKSWFRQSDDLADGQRELAVLNAAINQLNADVTRLQTPDGITEAARDEIGYVGNGEKRVTVTPAPAVSLTLPAGWPFDGVTEIIAVRAIAAPQPDAPATIAPVPGVTTAPAASVAPTVETAPALGTQPPAAG